MLPSFAGKALCNIILERLKEDRIWDEQAGFRKASSCCEQIATMSNIMEKILEWKFGLYLHFVDVENVFDSVYREVLWKMLLHC